MLENYFKNQYSNNKNLMETGFRFEHISVSVIVTLSMIGLSANYI